MRTHFTFLSTIMLSACLTAKPIDQGNDTGTNDTSSNGASATVADIQQAVIGDGEDVYLERVVITSTNFGEGFFVQDPGGGEWSGIYVYTQTMGGDFTPIVGDAVSISGTISEFYDYTELVLASAESISVVGEEQVVATSVSDVADWEPYEGCLVTLTDQTVVSAISSYGEVDLSGGITMDNLFFDFDTEYGATYTGVTGVISYSYEQFKINPRSESDLAGYVGGTGGETFTIADIQQNGLIGPAKLENVVVSAPMAAEGFWVQDAGGGSWSGLYVYTDRVDGEINISVGDVLNLTGEVSEYFDLTEISIGNLSDIESQGTTAEVTSVELTAEPSDWEEYEGVLITLADVTIGEGGDYGVYNLNYSGLLIDDELYDYAVNAGDSFTSLTGVVHYSYGEFKLYPRSESDFGDSTGTGDPTEPSSEPSGEPSTEPGPTTAASIISLQDGTVAMGTGVTVEGSIVTGINDSGSQIFIQDPTATEYAGIMIYLGGGGATVAVGDEVSVTGVVEDFYGRTNIAVDSASDITASGNTGSVTPVALSADATDWEVYEGMLVSLSSASVSSEPSQYNVSTLAEYSLSLDDGLFDYTTSASNGDAFTTVTGIVDEYYGWVLLPRSGADFVQ
ncbi:MAG: hypothetical protein CL916_01730 [Deltaproteobacteria bacterium]|nr:hypothetical protein [Deltaproteobacteria bacterium]